MELNVSVKALLSIFVASVMTVTPVVSLCQGCLEAFGRHQSGRARNQAAGCHKRPQQAKDCRACPDTGRILSSDMKWSDLREPVQPEVATMAILRPFQVDSPAWMARHDVDWASGLSPPDLLSLNRILRI